MFRSQLLTWSLPAVLLAPQVLHAQVTVSICEEVEIALTHPAETVQEKVKRKGVSCVLTPDCCTPAWFVNPVCYVVQTVSGGDPWTEIKNTFTCGEYEMTPEQAFDRWLQSLSDPLPKFELITGGLENLFEAYVTAAYQEGDPLPEVVTDALRQMVENGVVPFTNFDISETRWLSANHPAARRIFPNDNNVYAITYYHLVLARESELFTPGVDTCTQNARWAHEMTHVHQYRQMGWDNFIYYYLTEGVKGYENIPQEKEADLVERYALSTCSGLWLHYSAWLGDGPGVHDNPVLVGNVDGDSLQDLIFVGYDWVADTKLNVRTKFSVGDGKWSAGHDNFPDGDGVLQHPVLTGDFNGDGRTDLAFLGQDWQGAGLNIRVRYSNGDGEWASASAVLGDGAGVHSRPALVGDFDGDGDSDLAFVGEGWDQPGAVTIRTKFATGIGSWRSASQVQSDGSGVLENPSLLGDFNGDGRTDIAFVGQGWGGPGLNIRVKFSNGDGTWTSASEVLGDGAAVHEHTPLVGDYDGDGLTDIAFVGQGWSGNGLNIRTKLSNGDGTWRSESAVLGDGAGVHDGYTLVGDFDGDSRSDILFAFPMAEETVTVVGLRIKTSEGNGSWDEHDVILPEGPELLRYPPVVGRFTLGDTKDDVVFVGQNWDGKPGLTIRLKGSDLP